MKKFVAFSLLLITINIVGQQVEDTTVLSNTEEISIQKANQSPPISLKKK